MKEQYIIALETALGVVISQTFRAESKVTYVTTFPFPHSDKQYTTSVVLLPSQRVEACLQDVSLSDVTLCFWKMLAWSYAF
jgi:hypothetical protein